MAVRKIIRMGHPTLRRPALPLEDSDIGSDAVHRLVVDMIDTLHDYGGIGLAAPQVNESVRLAIVELPGGPSRYGELPELPLTIFVNPEIEVIDPAIAGYWKGVSPCRAYAATWSGRNISGSTRSALPTNRSRWS